MANCLDEIAESAGEEMKFWEAMRELEAGNKIRRKHFNDMEPHGFRGLVDLLKNCCGDEIKSFLSAEWELYEEPERTLSFMEVVQGLKEGKRFSRKEWIVTLPIETYGTKYICNAGGKTHLSIEDFEAADWVEASHFNKIMMKRIPSIGSGIAALLLEEPESREERQ